MSAIRKILVISPIPTHPQIAGNRTRIHRLLASLKEMGHHVHFLYVNTESDRVDQKQMVKCWGDTFYFVPYRRPKRSLKRYAGRLKFLHERGFTRIYPVDYAYDTSLDDFLHELTGRVAFDVVIVEYVFWTRALENFDPTVLKIVDTHDVFTRRHLMFLDAGQKVRWYSTTAKEETKALNRADIVIAIQQQEKQYFASLTNKKIVIVRHIAPLHRPLPGPLGEKRILFVGSKSGHNVSGIRYFLQEIFPRVRAALPSVALKLVGGVCDAMGDVDGCLKLGEVENITAIYDSADLVVNPVQFSTGLSIKMIEALGHSKPVVTTSLGSRGLEDAANKAFLVADSPAEFSRLVIKVLTDAELSGSLSGAAYEFVKEWNKESLEELAGILN
jgi:glycosyltransferase involved in cell wall biosynthesis